MSEIANQSGSTGEAPNTPPAKSKKAGKIAIALILLILLAVIGGLVYFIYTELLKPEETMDRIASTSGYVGYVDPKDLQAEADDTRYTTSMNVVWNFDSGVAESTDAYVGNASLNSRDVYFEVMLADNLEEVIYSSPVIPRGQALSKFKLDKELPAGTYDAICTYHLIDENEETVSELSIEVTINILS